MHKAIRRHISGVAVALWHAAERAVQKGFIELVRKPIIISGFGGRDKVTAALTRSLAANRDLRFASAALVLEVDDFRKIEEIYDCDLIEGILLETSKRLRHLLQASDVAARLEGPRFAIALTPYRRLDLAGAIQLAASIQRAMAEPIMLAQGNLHVTASVGFALASRLDKPTGAQLLRAAGVAQLEASRDGPNTIRSYSPAMHQRIITSNGLRDEVLTALDDHSITAFFQPQIDLTTGALTGLEALARWLHPQRGLIPPCDFLPILEKFGLMERLGQRMLSDALAALAAWDQDGIHVPAISINMSNSELRNPHLVDHIMMELDRHELAPERLVIEVLETVVVTGKDGITETNLSRLAAIGCGIDLDDFGTGHASITSIRKFAIQRIKIDRSFITNVDRDTEQQDMIAAILTMAARLRLSTLAEGVETSQEQDQLAQMGCQHMQGFALARPASFKDVTHWMQTYQPAPTDVADQHQPTNRRIN
ncbi:MAG: cyclic di-GMP phosphodiesterase Gmr [Yoonia sp.]|jgi:cyclic di-GMP phosphodiesterase Gmr